MRGNPASNFARGKISGWAYADEDELRDAREFFHDLDRETEELPDVSTEREPWRPDNQPHGRLGRVRNASVYE